jgi:hypothetical protein
VVDVVDPCWPQQFWWCLFWTCWTSDSIPGDSLTIPTYKTWDSWDDAPPSSSMSGSRQTLRLSLGKLGGSQWKRVLETNRTLECESLLFISIHDSMFYISKRWWWFFSVMNICQCHDMLMCWSPCKSCFSYTHYGLLRKNPFPDTFWLLNVLAFFLQITIGSRWI